MAKMGWVTAAVVLVLGLVIVQLLWQTSPSNRKVGYRRGMSWYLAQSDVTEPTRTPSYGDHDHTAPVPTRSIRVWSATFVVLIASVPLIWLSLGTPVLAVVAGVLAVVLLARAISAWRWNRLIERYRPIGEAATQRFERRKETR
jgi:hypothetical protein